MESLADKVKLIFDDISKLENNKEFNFSDLEARESEFYKAFL